MKSVILQSWRGSNMAGDEWVWSILATQRADHSWSLGASQVDQLTGKTYRLKGVYRLRSGIQFKEAIEQIFRHEEFSEIDIDWETIIKVLTKADKQLGAAIAQVLTDEEAEENAEPTPEQQLYIDAVSLVARSKWPRSNLRGAGGMGYAMQNAKLSRPIVTYALEYHAKHKEFPIGSHAVGEVEVVFAAPDKD